MIIDTQKHTTSTLATEKEVYGYIRISDVKQEQGASREAQKEAIVRYASQKGFRVIQWYQETKTAAKAGRPEFNKMMTSITKGNARGFIGHKIDRTSRNFDDWISMMKLHEKGYEIHFAHESVDLSERSGRLSADIQFIMACDYIRNLKQESKKGLYRRLKDGYYPWSAPIGYVNNGKGKLKTIDPVQSSNVKRLFDLYVLGTYSIHRLVPIMYEAGLRNHRGNKVDDNGIGHILKNPFYIGIMKIKGETYPGKHETFISPLLFKKAQRQRTEQTQVKHSEHAHTYRRLIHCKGCDKRIIGERQKGRVYYRCHTDGCKNTIREDEIIKQVHTMLSHITFSSKEAELFSDVLQEKYKGWYTEQEHLKRTLYMQEKGISLRLDKLTDAYLEGDIEKELYLSKKLILQEQTVVIHRKKERITGNYEEIFGIITKLIELAKNLVNTYDLANSEEKRVMLQNLTSNLVVHEKNLEFTMQSPYLELAKIKGFSLCAHSPVRHRTKQVSKYQVDIQPTPNELTKKQLNTLFETIFLEYEHLLANKQ